MTREPPSLEELLGRGPLPPTRPLFDQFVVKDDREKMLDSMEAMPRSRAAGVAIDPRDLQ